MAQPKLQSGGAETHFAMVILSLSPFSDTPEISRNQIGDHVSH